MNIRKNIKDFFIITFGTIIVGLSVFFFMMSSNVSIGSITALAMVIGNFVPLSVSNLTLIFNVVLLILGFLLIGKEFGIKTVYTAILLPVVLGVLEKIYPENLSLTNDPFIDMIAYCFFVSIGLAILFNNNASSGGLDIVAKLMNKFLRMELGKAMSLSGMCVAFSSALVYDKKIVVLSIIGTYLNGIILDHFIFGSTLKKRVCIISPKFEEIRQFIVNDLHSGATIYDTRGAYKEELRREIITIVDKNEYFKLMNFIQKVDKDAFVTVLAVNEVMYKPKI